MLAVSGRGQRVPSATNVEEGSLGETQGSSCVRGTYWEIKSACEEALEGANGSWLRLALYSPHLQRGFCEAKASFQFAG